MDTYEHKIKNSSVIFIIFSTIFFLFITGFSNAASSSFCPLNTSTSYLFAPASAGSFNSSSNVFGSSISLTPSLVCSEYLPANNLNITGNYFSNPTIIDHNQPAQLGNVVWQYYQDPYVGNPLTLPIANIEMQNDTYDSSLNGNNGTLVGTANFTSGSNCHFGDCLYSNYTGGIVIYNSSLLNTSSSFTVNFWADASSFTTGNTWYYPVGDLSSTGAGTYYSNGDKFFNFSGFEFGFVGSSPKYSLINCSDKGIGNDTSGELFAWDGTFNTNSSMSQGDACGPIVSTNVWNMYTITYNGSFTSIYLNGTLEDSVPMYINVSDGQNLTFGKSNDGYFDGYIEMGSVFNQPLTSSQVSQLYSEENTGIFNNDTRVQMQFRTENYTFNDSGLVLWWDLGQSTTNETQLGTTLDLSGNSNNGILQGSPINNTLYTIGDSITSGFSCTPRGNDYQIGLDSLMGSDAYYHVHATEGFNCSSVLNYYEQYVPAGNNVTVISLCGLNDLNIYNDNNTEVENAIAAIYNYSVYNNNTLILNTLPPDYYKPTQCTSNITAINIWLRNYTSFYGIPLFDLYNYMGGGTACSTPAPYFCSDNEHFTPIGDGYWATGLWKDMFNSTIWNQTKPSVGTGGPFGSYLNFDGGVNNQTVFIRNDTSLNIFNKNSTTYSNFSIEIWLNPLNYSTPATSGAILGGNSVEYFFANLAKNVNGPSNGTAIGIDLNYTGQNCVAGNLLVFNGTLNNSGVWCGGNVTFGQWSQITLESNGTNLNVTLNGTLIGNSVPIQFVNEAGPLFVGSWYNVSSLDGAPDLATNFSTVAWNYFNGSIAQLKIWNRTLSLSEVDSLYNNGNPTGVNGIQGNWSNWTSLSTQTNNYPINTFAKIVQYNSVLSSDNLYFSPYLVSTSYSVGPIPVTNITYNTTTAGQIAGFIMNWSDSNLSNYTFSLDSGNGTFVNYTTENFTSNNQSSYDIQLNSTGNSTVRFLFYATDSLGFTVQGATQQFTTPIIQQNSGGSTSTYYGGGAVTDFNSNPYCGDGICQTNIGENCNTCPKDCGVCSNVTNSNVTTNNTTASNQTNNSSSGSTSSRTQGQSGGTRPTSTNTASASNNNNSTTQVNTSSTNNNNVQQTQKQPASNLNVGTIGGLNVNSTAEVAVFLVILVAGMWFFLIKH